MKAVILEKINSPLIIADIEPTTLGHGQVFVKVLVSGLCGAQLQEIAGHKGNAKFTPHLLGHEGCGIVEKLGEGVTKVKIGDKVVMHWRKGDGIESDFPQYIYNDKKIQSGKVTTLSEYSIVSENRITPVPSDTSEELCALLGCGMSTGFGVISNEANIKQGESLMIVGAGGVGLNVLNAAKLAGISPIIVVDAFDYKKELVETMGADLFINIKKKNVQQEIFDKFGFKEIDVIVDTSGNKESIENTLTLLSGKGRYIMVGQPIPGESIEIKNANHLFGGEGKTIKATQGGRFYPTTDIPKFIKLYKQGGLDIDKIITHRIKLDQINDAVDLVRSGQAGRIMIKIQ